MKTRETWHIWREDFVLAICALTSLILTLTVIWMTKPSTPKQPPKPQPVRFEVVDKYGRCDVVRYAPPGKAQYGYLLHCP